MYPPGHRLRPTREALGLTYRDVEKAGYQIAVNRGRPDFILHISRLADIREDIDELASRLRRERKGMALQYVNYLQKEYQLLLEASRIRAKIAPEVSPVDELGRFRLNVRFVLCCRHLRCRLWFGLQPGEAFGILSDMEGDLTLRLEMAPARNGERAALAPESPLPLENRRRDSK